SKINNASNFFQINNILENYNPEPVLGPNHFDDEFADVIKITEHYDNVDTLIYCMDEIEQFISMQFQNAELSDKPTKFAFEIELDPKLLDSVALSQDLETNLLDLKKIKNSFAQLTKILILLLESGSKYYWEEVKRQSEACAAIKRFSCKDKVTININIIQQYAKEAKQWIQRHLNYNLRSSELYRYLIENKLINLIYTKEQLLSSKAYLEWPEIAARRFKILSYFDNNFVYILGFATPLLNQISVEKINKIVVDSTFKTNQE
ncbi:19252_t:CDS:2, partial [Cetraspora pellucida]